MPDYSKILIDELQQTLGTISIKRTIEALKNARLTGDPVQLHISFVCDLVCGHFSTTIEKIREGAQRQDMTYAKGFIVHYLRTEFKIEWKELRQLLDRDQSRLFRCGKLIKELDDKLELHKTYCQKKEIFDQKIKQYQQQLKK